MHTWIRTQQPINEWFYKIIELFNLLFHAWFASDFLGAAIGAPMATPLKYLSKMEQPQNRAKQEQTESKLFDLSGVILQVGARAWCPHAACGVVQLKRVVVSGFVK